MQCTHVSLSFIVVILYVPLDVDISSMISQWGNVSWREKRQQSRTLLTCVFAVRQSHQSVFVFCSQRRNLWWCVEERRIVRDFYFALSLPQLMGREINVDVKASRGSLLPQLKLRCDLLRLFQWVKWKFVSSSSEKCEPWNRTKCFNQRWEAKVYSVDGSWREQTEHNKK